MKNTVPPLPARTDLCAQPVEVVVDYLLEHDQQLRSHLEREAKRSSELKDDNERLRRLLVQFKNHVYGSRRDSIGESVDTDIQPMLGLDLATCDNDAAFVDGLAGVLASAVGASDAANDTDGQQTGGQGGGTDGSKRKWERKSLPAHLQREVLRYWPDGIEFKGDRAMCTTCQAPARPIGEDRCEQLEYVPARFKVLVHVRPKFVCTCCNRLMQAKANARPIAQGSVGPALGARLLTNKFDYHMPLNRQSKEFKTLGVELSTSLLSNWGIELHGSTKRLLTLMREHVFAGPKLHADDTRLRVLRHWEDADKPGRPDKPEKPDKAGRSLRNAIAPLCKSHTDYLWAYVRHDGNAGHPVARAVWFEYSQGRGAEYPTEHLKDYKGYVQCDAYGAFNETFRSGERKPVFCWAHLRRKLTDFVKTERSPGITKQAGNSSLAEQLLAKIQTLYRIEKRIRGQLPQERRLVRQQESVPLLRALGRWVMNTLNIVSRRSELGQILLYLMKRWRGFRRYGQNGWLEMDNNHAENAIRPVAVGRHAWLFAGSERGARAAAGIYSLIATAKVHGHNVERYLTLVFQRLPGMADHEVSSLLPWNLSPEAVDSAMQGSLQQAA
jgi:transposase